MSTNDESWGNALQLLRDALSEVGMPPEGVDEIEISRGRHGSYLTAGTTVITPVRDPHEVRVVTRAVAWAYRQGLRE